MEVLIAIAIVALVAAFVSVPLRRAVDSGDAAGTDDGLAALEARKQAKYREIRDTELDRAQGKLTEADFERQNAELRAEAIAILKRIDERRAAAARRQAGSAGGPDRESAGDSV
jgi:hypothetical protein